MAPEFHRSEEKNRYGKERRHQESGGLSRVGFGVRNFEHLDVGLKEMYRVLKTDGKLVILELSVPSNPMIRWCYKLYFLKILPAIGGFVPGISCPGLSRICHSGTDSCKFRKRVL